MVTLPLTFLSSALMQQSLLPSWIGWIAEFNPVNWAAEAGRSAAGTEADWGAIASRTGLHAASTRQRRVRDPGVQLLPAVDVNAS